MCLAVVVQVTSETGYALERWRENIYINDDPHRPVTKHLFDGLEPLAEYEMEIYAKNYLGESPVTKFVFETSEGLSTCFFLALFLLPCTSYPGMFCLIYLLFRSLNIFFHSIYDIGF